ncbi:MAG: hemolysin III family protein [Frankiaceae bacterium]|nr:hemolysin III family protein [Frankiaceae bacterium]MBV9871925.1 hemolysin III family protein [Frankiaceae bacterium]
MTEPGELASAALSAGARAVERATEAVGDVVAAAKPKLRGWLHTVTSPVALAAGVVLIVLAPTGPATAAAAAYTATSVILFTTSALYHRGDWSPAAENRLKRLDHANIFLLIAGSYTPFAVLALDGNARVAVLSAVWGAAVVGVLFRVFWVEAPRWLYTALYIGLGWAAGFFFPQLIRGAGIPAFVLIAVGGLLYTAGGVVYGLKRPDPSPKWFGFHEIFHACTVAAFACQYIAASFVVYRAA